MDRNKSTKLNGLIAKLTIAANRAVKKNETEKTFTKRPVKPEYQAPIHLNHFDQRLRTFKPLD
jgi:hypothetical protein